MKTIIENISIYFRKNRSASLKAFFKLFDRKF